MNDGYPKNINKYNENDAVSIENKGRENGKNRSIERETTRS